MSKAKQTAGKTAQGAATRKGKGAARAGALREVIGDNAFYATLEKIAADKLRKRIGGDAYAMLEKIAKAMNSVSWTDNDNTPVSLYREFLLSHRKNPAGWARSIVLHIVTGAKNSVEDLKRRDELRAAFESGGLAAGGADIAKLKALAAKQTAEKAARKCGGGRLAHAWERTPNTRKSVFWMNADTLESLDKIAKNNGAKSRADALKTIIKKLTGATVKVSFDSDSNRIGAEAETPHPDCALFGTISGEAGIIFGEGWRRFRAMGLKLKMDADALVKYLVEEGYHRWLPSSFLD